MSLKKLNNLTVAYREMTSFFEVSKDGSRKPTGIEGNLLVTLMEALGIRYNLLVEPYFDSGTENKNGSWTGLMGLVQRGEADMAITTMIQNYRRSKAVDFTVPYLFSNVNFVTGLPKPHPRAYAFVYPFDVATWTLLISSILILPAVFVALFGSRDYSKEWLRMLGNVLGKCVPQTISGPPQTLFLVPWWFGTLVLSFSYSSLFFSCLSVPPLTIPPKDFFELAEEVKSGRFKVFSHQNASSRKMLKESTSDRIQSIIAAIKRNGWYVSNQKTMGRDVVGDRSAYIGSSVHFRITYGEGPFMSKFLSEGWIDFYCGVVVSKRLPGLTARLNRLLLKVQQAGLIEKFIRDAYFKAWKLTSESKTEAVNSPLSLQEILGASAILVCGWGLSGIVLIVERMSCHSRKS